MMRRTVTPLVNAVSTLVLLFSVAILLGAWLIGRLRRQSAIAGRSSSWEPKT
jgi:spermidine/putrescine transport system permease protein